MEQPTARRSALPYALALVYAALPPLVLELIAVFGDHGVTPGECEGIGGGCVLSTSDTATFLLEFFVLPGMVVWAAVALLVLAVLRRRPAFRARPVALQGLLLVAPGWFLLALVFVFI